MGSTPSGTPRSPYVRFSPLELAPNDPLWIDCRCNSLQINAGCGPTPVSTGKVEDGIRQRFAKALEVKAHADDDVAAGRGFVAAYVDFVHYVEGLHEMAGGGVKHDRE